MDGWNPWHGCHRISAGCKNCYVYRRDNSVGRDASQVYKTASFYLPRKRDRAGNYKLTPGREVFTCGTSDFFIDEADEWRREAWDMIRERRDLRFLIITKRIHRFHVSLPDDWGDGWDHVLIGCTCENQQMAEYRLPLYLAAPLKHRMVMCEPLISPIEFGDLLCPELGCIEVGGESGTFARVCDYDWVLDIRSQCVVADVPFYFRQTGTHLKKDGKVYTIPRKLHGRQARAANINYRY